MRANETQVGGTHYEGRFQHWDFTVAVLRNRYLEGQITKYVSRWRKKNGLQDLQKAEHFLHKLAEEYKDGRVSPLMPMKMMSKEALGYCVANELEGDDRIVIMAVASWSSIHELNQAHAALERMIKTAR